MSTHIARGATSSKTNPLLDIWTLNSSFELADADQILFQIFDISDATKLATPEQVFPVVVDDTEEVDLGGDGKVSTGRAVADWSPGDTEPLGRHRIIWFVTQEPGGDEVQYIEEFDVLAASTVVRGPMYALLSDLRNEGINSTTLADARALYLIGLASRQVERYTHRFFEPMAREFSYDGSAGQTLFFELPIILLSEVSIDGQGVDASSYQVYNRHLRQSLTNPDDRDNPRITFSRQTRLLTQTSWDDRPFVNKQVWWPGAQNVTVSGLFGYTDPDPTCQVGVTPEDIKRVTIMLVQRQLALAGSGDLSDVSVGPITSIRTRDQSVTYGAKAGVSGAGGFTGDTAIDDILALYSAPPFVGAP